ncbi:hypothetical protein ABBQ38_006286 [Trebouxia sp. C0009 RCD-2024]
MPFAPVLLCEASGKQPCLSVQETALLVCKQKKALLVCKQETALLVSLEPSTQKQPCLSETALLVSLEPSTQGSGH